MSSPSSQTQAGRSGGATLRLISQIAVQITDRSPLLGQREGVLLATVRMYYGLDLRKLDAAAISRRDRNIERELRNSLQPCAARFFADQRMLPTRAKIVQRLQNYVAPLERELGMRIELR